MDVEGIDEGDATASTLYSAAADNTGVKSGAAGPGLAMINGPVSVIATSQQRSDASSVGQESMLSFSQQQNENTLPVNRQVYVTDHATEPWAARARQKPICKYLLITL